MPVVAVRQIGMAPAFAERAFGCTCWWIITLYLPRDASVPYPLHTTFRAADVTQDFDETAAGLHLVVKSIVHPETQLWRSWAKLNGARM